MQDAPDAGPESPKPSESPPAASVPASHPPAIRPGALLPASERKTPAPHEARPDGLDPTQLAVWEKLGLAGTGAAIVGVALLAHLAAPVAVFGVIVGGGMVTAGFGFRRPLRAFRVDKGGMTAEAEAISESVAIAKDAEELTRSQLALVRAWTQDQQRVLAFVADSNDATETTRRVADFMRNRLADLTEALAESDESVRASVWLMSPHTNRLQFALGSEIEDPGKTFADGEGFIGRAFADNEIKNIAAAPRRPEYTSAEPNEPFHGLLCIPLKPGSGAPIGVMCIDRTNAEVFPQSSVDLSATLAALLGGVLTAPPARRSLP
ncbi:MAG: GAF domain-containing protein [Candidatus Eremiobacteraeota bacterium]|nr:GAF domain-containing protein [Candidatus Eremiobacteraeota bacterium]